MLQRLISLALASATLATAASADTISITVENIKTETGNVHIALHTEDTFLRGEGLDRHIVEVSGDTLILTMENVTPGTYALAAFHDIDDDGGLDANLMGIPSEPYGFSNRAKARFGPPKFDAASFTVTENGAEQVIHLN